MTTTTGYAVIYRATEDSDEAARNTLDAAEREDVALADVIEVCKSCHADAAGGVAMRCWASRGFACACESCTTPIASVTLITDVRWADARVEHALWEWHLDTATVGDLASAWSSIRPIAVKRRGVGRVTIGQIDRVVARVEHNAETPRG